MRNLPLIVFVLLLSPAALPAQVQRIGHQTFAVSDSVQQLQLQFFGQYEVESWAGNNILLETKVRLFNASQGILEHFLEAGRYEVKAEEAGMSLTLSAVDKERRPIQTSNGNCFEEVMQRVFIPEAFIPSGEGQWRRFPPGAEGMPSDSIHHEVKGGIPGDGQPDKKEGNSGNG